MNQSKVASADEGRVQGDVVTVAQLCGALRARLHVILGVTVAVAISTAVVVFLMTPRFASEAQLLLESRESVYTRALGERELPGGVFDEQAVASQVQVISSRDVAREVIRRLGLVGHPEFDPLMGPMDPIARIRLMLGASQGMFEGAEEERIFESYYRRLLVYPVARSRVVAIRFTSADPELAARAANTIAQVYLEQLEEAKTDLARAASTWLGTSIEELRDRVSAAEAEVEEFRARSGLLVGGNNATITSQQLSDINTELAQARSAQADAQARARLISDMIASNRAFEIPDVASNETIVRLLEQRVGLRSQLALEQRTLLPQHPRILELRAQLADLDAEITVAAQRTVRILENSARLAGSRVESLEAALEAQMRVVAQANENEVRLRAMEREARAEREQLEAYLIRYREALARGAQSASLPDARIVSRAVAALEPSFPRKVPMIVLATFAAAFMVIGFIVVRELAFGVPATAGAHVGSAPPAPQPPKPPSTPRGRSGKSLLDRWRRRKGAREAELPQAAPAHAAVALSASAEASAHAVQSMAQMQLTAATPAGLLRGTLDAGSVELVDLRAASAPGSTADDPEEAPRATPVTENPVSSAPVEAVEKAEDEEAARFVSRSAAKGEGVGGFDQHDEPARDRHEDMERAAPIQMAPEAATAEAPSVEVIGEVLDDRTANRAARVVEEPLLPEAAAGGNPQDDAPPAAAQAVPGPPIEDHDIIEERNMRASAVGGAGEKSDDSYHFDALVARVAHPPVEGRGRRVLVTGLGDPQRLASLALQFARQIALEKQAIFVATQPVPGDDELGLTDLIAENASFFHVIRGDAEQRLHRVSAGRADGALLAQEPHALEIGLAAFDQTYQWVVLSMPDPTDVAVYKLLAKSVDSVVLASDQEPSNPAVLALYDTARRAGASQVIVAYVGEVAKAAAA